MNKVIGEEWTYEGKTSKQKLEILIGRMKEAKKRLDATYTIDTPEYCYFNKAFDSIMSDAEKMLLEMEK